MTEYFQKSHFTDILSSDFILPTASLSAWWILLRKSIHGLEYLTTAAFELLNHFFVSFSFFKVAMSYLFSSNPRKLLCSLATVMRCRLQLMDVKRRREKLTVFFGFCIFSLYILFYRNKETAGKPFL